MPAAQLSASRSLVVRAGGHALELKAADVEEVARLPQVTPVPLAPDALEGLASLRGRVIPVVSMARLLGVREVAGRGRRMVVLRRADPIALAVDDVDSGEAAGEAASGQALDDLLREAFAAARAPQARAMRHAETVAVRAAAATTRQDLAILTFRVAGQAYGLPLAAVREVFRAPDELLRLQNADDVALGVIAHRGGALAVVSPAALLGLGQSGRTGRASIVVMALGPAAIGLLVEEVRAVARVAEDELKPVPAVLNRGRGEAEVQAIARTDDGLVALLSPKRMFDHQTVAAVLAASEAEAAPMAETIQSQTESFLIFRLGEERFGMPSSSVIEIVPLPETLSPPPASVGPVLAGIMDHRGAPLPVIDPAARLGLGRGERRRRVVVLDAGGQRCGLAVDAVEALTRIETERLGETTELAEAGARLFHRAAIVEVDGRPVLFVDPAALLGDAERSLLADLDAHVAAQA